MAAIWLAVSFDYYLINFLASHFEEAYLVVITSQISEISAKIAGGMLYRMIGTKRSLIYCLGMSSAAGLAIIFYGLAHQHSLAFFLMILVAKFGVASSFCVVFIAHASIFPTMFAATSFGFCNFMARATSAVAPLLAEVAQPVPMICFTAAAAIACVLSFLIQVKDDNRDKENCEEVK